MSSRAPQNQPPPALSVSADARFQDLHSANCNPAVRDAIERIVRHGSDIDCYKINALRVAEGCGVTLNESLRALLFATELGVLDLNYDVFCPSCRGTTEYSKHLMGLGHGSSCNLCAIDFKLEFLETVEVTFTVNANVRAIEVTDFSDRDYEGKVEYFKQVAEREGRRPVLSAWFQPGERKAVPGRIDQIGEYTCYVASNHQRGAVLRVFGEPVDDVQVIDLEAHEDGAITPKEVAIRPGEIELRIANRFPREWPILVRERGSPRNWLSAAYVTSQQDFRDLFSGEFLAPGAAFAIRNTTLLFTDIRRSTELFEELGDSAAYALVQDHFQVMTDIIRARQGGVVKTIGDAVMAAFPVNRDAVAAACDIQGTFLRAPVKNRFIQIKLGLHRGPTIAVTSNRNLDYFGRTVNIAARIQGKSEANQVLLSDQVASDPEVRALLGERGIDTRPFTTTLRGLDESFQLHAIEVKPEQTPQMP